VTESFVQLPADSTGKKLHTRQRVIGANTVQEEATWRPGRETWYAYADAVAFAANKHHISIFNAAGSGKIIRVPKLFAINLQSAAVTGIIDRFDFKKITASSAGTTITPESADTSNPALPAQVTVRTNGTITEGNVLFPWLASSEEETAVAGLSRSMFQQWSNIIPEGEEIQEPTAREGQGLTMKQITSSVVGSFGWLMVFTVDDG
jgi:hypothetical protein